VTLAPDAARRNEEDGRRPGAQQEVARQQGDSGEILTEEEGYGERVGGEDRAEGGGEDGREAEDESDEIPAPERPIEGIIRVIGGLGDLMTDTISEEKRSSAMLSSLHGLSSTDTMGTYKNDGVLPAVVDL
jgi:hypothetical protein